MILAAFGLLHVTECSIMCAVRVLHVFRHFSIIIIVDIVVVVITVIINIIFIIVIAIVVITIINIIFITSTIIRLLGFLIKNSLLFL